MTTYFRFSDKGIPISLCTEPTTTPEKQPEYAQRLAKIAGELEDLSDELVFLRRPLRDTALMLWIIQGDLVPARKV